MDFNLLLKDQRRDVLNASVDNRPDITGRLHLAITVIKLLKKLFAGDLQITKIVTVPHHAHGVSIMEGNGEAHAGAKTGHVKARIKFRRHISRCPVGWHPAKAVARNRKS